MFVTLPFVHPEKAQRLERRVDRYTCWRHWFFIVLRRLLLFYISLERMSLIVTVRKLLVPMHR